MTRRDIGYPEALALSLEHSRPLPPVTLPVWEACGMVLAQDVHACVDSPSLTAAARDGFAVRSKDVANATVSTPVTLEVKDTVVAGAAATIAVEPGTAVKVMTGAPLPKGADAVVSVEFTKPTKTSVSVERDAGPGRNVMERGCDVADGDQLATKGTLITPAMTGYFAAGGRHEVQVIPLPRIAVVATGDEVVAPGCGHTLEPGQLYASNLVTLQSWLRRFDMPSSSAMAPDDFDRMCEVIDGILDQVDVVLTSGGAWKSERDHSAEVFVKLGFELIYHRVRLGPGKAIAFAVRDDKWALCLPGGPPSNEMAFLQLALPAILRLSGRNPQPFPVHSAVLSEPIRKHHDDPTWSTYFQAELSIRNGRFTATPLRHRSRLATQAYADGLIVLPEGVLELPKGASVDVQILNP